MNWLVNIIENAVYIIQGYTRWIYDIITGKVKHKAKYRLTICNQCENNKNGICNICGCIIKAKVRVNYMEDENGISIDGCPNKKW